MSVWSEMSEAEKDAARLRYCEVAEIGMDPARRKGVEVDDYLESLYAKLPTILKLAAALSQALGGKGAQ